MQISLRPLATLCLALLATPVLAAPAAKAAPASSAQAAPLALAHQLSDEGEIRLRSLVDQFNAQSPTKLQVVRAAAGAPPALLNLLTSNTVVSAQASRKAFVPLHKLLSDHGVSLNAGGVSADIKAESVDAKGRLIALPMAYSTPVMFYNKGMFRKAKLDPENPPKTWMELQDALGKLVDAGSTCPYTTSHPTWVHIDNASALSGVPVATEGKNGQLAFNGLPQVKHLAMLATWAKARYFIYHGRGAEADEHFAKGECAVLTSNSWVHSKLREAPGIELGIAPMPHHDDVYGGRQHTLAGGGSLWVGAGFKTPEYQLAASFLKFVLSPERQLELSRVGGFLPLTDGARNILRSKLLRDEEQALSVAYKSMRNEGATHPLRISTIDPVRIIIDEEMEALWTDKKPAKAALDTAVARGNAILRAKPTLKSALQF